MRAQAQLARRVDVETATRVHALNLPGVGLVPESRRVYTMGGAAGGTTLAAQVLGFVNVDGVGQYGVEGANDPFLAGTPDRWSPRRTWRAAHRGLGPRAVGSRRWRGRDADHRRRAPAPSRGGDARYFTRNRAQGVTGLIMDVNTGAIMALASVPTFDANNTPRPIRRCSRVQRSAASTNPGPS